ncbi:DUF3068 domain-containing protein [Actinomadura kijaniata]|uniref:DUF3068 domain-containing protein n=1 Tax=Actinomadura kijaniata TaxID=46161 RepID=UPI00082C21A1|nr:DUF3068 domain-containing protein [Actinomadura kijaniata]
MRRPLSLILIALGAFCLTLAPLVKFYVAERTVLAPLNRYQRSQLVATNAQYFDMATFRMRKGVTLVAENTVRGDTRANGGNDSLAVWDSSSIIYDKAFPDRQVDIQSFRIAFDRRTSELTECCGAHVGGDPKVRMSGYGLLYPLANVDKRDYPFFDLITRQTVPMRFQGEEEIGGIDAYRFVQQVPVTRTGAVEAKVPGDLLGMGKNVKPQKVDRYASATITQWVDPRTGVPVRVDQKVDQFVRTPDGRGRMTIASADLRMTEASVASLVKLSDENAFKIAMVRSYVPYGGVLAGLALLLLGGIAGLLNRGRRGKAVPAPPAPRRPDGKFGDTGPAPVPAPEPVPGRAAARTVPPPAPRRTDGKFGGVAPEEAPPAVPLTYTPVPERPEGGTGRRSGN